LLAGFFFYSALFAAVGSAVNEDMREAQSLSFPLMMPIIFSVTLMGAVLKDPTGAIGFLGKPDPFYFTYYNDDKIAFRCAGHGALVATWTFHVHTYCRFHIYNLVCRQNLSHRYINVW
jgi:ABC-2 type transport system permease protein